jgi:hypothetical protein
VRNIKTSNSQKFNKVLVLTSLSVLSLGTLSEITPVITRADTVSQVPVATSQSNSTYGSLQDLIDGQFSSSGQLTDNEIQLIKQRFNSESVSDFIRMDSIGDQEITENDYQPEIQPRIASGVIKSIIKKIIKNPKLLLNAAKPFLSPKNYKYLSTHIYEVTDGLKLLLKWASVPEDAVADLTFQVLRNFLPHSVAKTIGEIVKLVISVIVP